MGCEIERFRRRGLALAGAALLASCATSSPDADLKDTYLRSIHAAAIHRDGAARPLTPITASEVEVVTWGRPSMAEGVLPHAMTTGWPIWVTVVPRLRQDCSSYSADGLQLRLEQHLGLPPGGGAGRVLISLRVVSADLFRPCADPSIAAATCSDSIDPATFESRPKLAAFLLKQIFDSYKDPAGYPFTRLGYTYDWSPDSADHVGPDEFVIGEGARVTVLATAPAASYCAKPAP